MVDGFYDEVVRLLKEVGYFRTEGGKHQKWRCKGRPTVIVPHKIVSQHTANNCLKQAGLPKRF